MTSTRYTTPPPMRYERALLHVAGQCNPGDTEGQVHQVMQHRHVEDSEKCGIGVMPGEGELVIVRRDARNEAEHADGQKHCADRKSSVLDGRPKFRGGLGRACRMKCGHKDFH